MQKQPPIILRRLNCPENFSVIGAFSLSRREKVNTNPAGCIIGAL